MNTVGWVEFREKTLKLWDPRSPEFCATFLNGNKKAIRHAFHWSESPYPCLPNPWEKQEYWRKICRYPFKEPSREDILFVTFMATGVISICALPPGGDWE